MVPTTSLPRLSRILLFCLFTSSITQASGLLPRQDAVCGGIDSLQQCGSGFPSSFCCPKDATCMSLTSASIQSVICCPSGSDCNYIQTVTCDVNQLNATLHPDNQMHLSDTTGVNLPKCGNGCCPLGYTCKGGMCSNDSASPSSTAKPSPSATNPASASQTSNSPVIAPAQTSQGFNGRSFAVGLFPGIVIGALGTIAFIWLVNRRRESKSKERYSGDFGHVARQISDPIYDPAHAARTDFIRRGSQSAQPSPSSTHRLVDGEKDTNKVSGSLTPRIKSMWDRTPKLNFGFSPGLPASPLPVVRAGRNNVDPYTTPPPRPSRTQANRGGSQETIDVLMPALNFPEPPKPPGARDNRFTTDSTSTTFTRLMERAGFDDDGRRDVRDWKNPKKL